MKLLIFFRENELDLSSPGDLIYQVHKVIRQWFPDLSKWLATVPDRRKFHEYSMASILTQGIFMFLCQGNSRNQMNNMAAFGSHVKENFMRLFPEMRWAHFDSIDWCLRSIKMREIEEVKTLMLKSMITRKRIDTAHGYYLVVFDATGVTSYDDDPEGVLLHRSSQGGKKRYLNYMLEAKIVTPEGLCISLASEPLSNAEQQLYQKQDCELKAYKRLAAKIKQDFPRLPICVLADGLYANKPVFDICEAHHWKYLITLKDTCLPHLQEAIIDTKQSERVRFEKKIVTNAGQKEKKNGIAKYQWIAGLDHKGLRVNVLECLWPTEATTSPEVSFTKFSYVTNLEPDRGNPFIQDILAKMVTYGRLRWKIENEGFNTQKHLGYNLHHKYSRQSVATLHVYYALLQIAHLINQLAIHSTEVVRLLEKHPKLTLKYLWEKLRSMLDMCLLSLERLDENEGRCQIRLE